MQFLEATRPFIEKKVDPGLLTFEEYYNLLNPRGKSHPDSAYDYDLAKINGWDGDKTSYPELLRTVRIHNIKFEIRLRREDRYRDRSFAKIGPDNHVLRDDQGDIIYFTREELLRDGQFRRYNYAIGVFDDATRVAFTADEWGCMLIAVAREYRRFGLGQLIQRLAREIEPAKNSGGFTANGARTLRRIHSQFVREYLASGMYSFLVRSGQLTIDRVKKIVNSAAARPPPRKQLNLNTNNPEDWLLYAGEAGDFIIYDRKLKLLVDQGLVDDTQYSYWADRMIIGAAYASGTISNPVYAHMHQFGGRTEPIKMFLMRLVLSVLAKEREILVVTPTITTYVKQPGIAVSGDEARLLSNPIDYMPMAAAEWQWRKSFDRYDEFRCRLLEMAHQQYFLKT